MLSGKTVLITGASGYLGRHVAVRAMKNFRVYGTYHTRPESVKAGHPVPLDLENQAAVQRLVDLLSPQAIIHTAAINPGGNEQKMMQINATGSGYVAEAAARAGARLIHLSTDVVHDGRHAPYADDAPPAPLNAYGRSKAAAEDIVTRVAPRAAIIRTSLIYGLAQMDRGTAGFAERLRSGQPLVLFNDVIRQPVWVATLVEAILKLITLDFAGILNVAGRQALTREEFGRRMLDWWQVGYKERVTSGRAAAISQTIPLDLRLSVDQGEQFLLMAFPGVDQVLAMHRRGLAYRSRP